MGRLLVEAGSACVRVGQPFLVLMAALGSGAIVTGAAMKDVADTWAAADGEPRRLLAHHSTP